MNFVGKQPEDSLPDTRNHVISPITEATTMIAMNIPTKAKFPMGQILSTPGALDALAEAGQDLAEFLIRHVQGDWGEMSDGDKQLNEEALVDGSRIMSAYRTSKGTKLWIITEAADDKGHRCATTALKPEEY